MDKILNIALIGQGRSGRDIHGAYLRSDAAKARFRVAAVAESDPLRRARAEEEFGCAVYADYRALLERKDIDLVVNTLPSFLHYNVTMEFLQKGFSVLLEKPACQYSLEFEKLMRVAKEQGVLLTVFHESRFVPYYQCTKEILRSGVLGKIHQIHLNFSGYSRRWDWQCSRQHCAGALMNTGSHPLDMAIDLLEMKEMPGVCAELRRINTAGDAEDYARLILQAPGMPLADVEVNPADAYSDHIIKLCGDRGTLVASAGQVRWKYFDETPLPELQLKPLCGEDGRSPAFCTETLQWNEFCEDVDSDIFYLGTAGMYRNIYEHLVSGAPTEVRLEQILLQIRIMELAHAKNPPMEIC